MGDELPDLAASVLLVDDHQVVRDGLRLLLEAEGYRVVAEASDGREAVRLASSLTPGVAIMDLSMPELNGIDATRHIVAACPGTRVIALSGHQDDATVVEVFRAGARGYVLKGDAFAELVRALQAVLSGQCFVSPRVAQGVIARALAVSSGGEPRARVGLSAREREVVQLVAEGYTTKEIAARLFVSVKTVEAYRKTIMDKLEIRSIAGLTKWAIREGLTPAE